MASPLRRDGEESQVKAKSVPDRRASAEAEGEHIQHCRQPLDSRSVWIECEAVEVNVGGRDERKQ